MKQPAEMIRLNPQMQGKDDQMGITHKTALFTDDILLFITNPEDSVPATMTGIMENYQAISLI